MNLDMCNGTGVWVKCVGKESEEIVKMTFIKDYFLLLESFLLKTTYISWYLLLLLYQGICCCCFTGL